MIDNVLHGRDTLAIMPTGGGKSLCYQIPALIFPGLTVVVSPLIALMKDQVEQLHELGVPALFLNSSLSFEEYDANMEQVRSGKVKLLYVAPETLLTARLFDLLLTVRIDCLTIDEAHCISEWGHDFRPEYRQLASVRHRFPKAVCLALTATATQRVRADIMSTLHFSAQDEFVASFNRENLLIEVLPKSNPADQTLQFLQNFKNQSGIIYCFTRRQVDELAFFLAGKGFATRPYHAGLEDIERKRNQEAFLREDVQIIVATIAFGMGINKPNVRFIVHYDLPKSIENYYQEIGRAGRDGLPAHCLLLYSYGDAQKLRYFIDQKEEQERQVAFQHLAALTHWAESAGCRRVPLLAYFGENYTGGNCGMCDNCLAAKSKNGQDITIPAHKFLSCVKRTGEMFGAAHIADVLLGSQNVKVLKYNHQQVTTYGIGKELTKKQWIDLSRQLVQKGFLLQDDQFGGLKLTPEAYAAFKSKALILGVLQREIPASHAKGKQSQVSYDHDLFEVLRQKRKELADNDGIPPYVIFSDRTLAEMATYYPQSQAALLKINGVGEVKLKRYGKVFMDLIVDFCHDHAIEPKDKPEVSAEQTRKSGTSSSGKTNMVGEAYNAGVPVLELMNRFQVTQTTILNHLTRYVQEGNKLRRSEELLDLSRLPSDVQAEVLVAFAEQGDGPLRQIYDRFNGEVLFDELTLLRLFFLASRE